MIFCLHSCYYLVLGRNQLESCDCSFPFSPWTRFIELCTSSLQNVPVELVCAIANILSSSGSAFSLYFTSFSWANTSCLMCTVSKWDTTKECTKRSWEYWRPELYKYLPLFPSFKLPFSMVFCSQVEFCGLSSSKCSTASALAPPEWPSCLLMHPSSRCNANLLHCPENVSRKMIQ